MSLEEENSKLKELLKKAIDLIFEARDPEVDFWCGDGWRADTIKREAEKLIGDW